MSLELTEVTDKNGRQTRRWKRTQVAVAASRVALPPVRAAVNESTDLPELEPHISYEGMQGGFITFRLGPVKMQLEEGNTEDCWLNDEQYPLDTVDQVSDPGTLEDLLDYHNATKRQPALPFVESVPLCIKGSDFSVPLRSELHKKSFDASRVDRATSSMDGYINKPAGGLWASPIEDYSDDPQSPRFVSRWEERTGFRNERENAKVTYHSVSVHPEANVLIIDSWEDYAAVCAALPLQHREGGDVVRPDYAAMAEHGIDALYLTDQGLQECDSYALSGSGYIGFREGRSRDGYEGLDHWELPSMVFFNPAAVVVEAQGTRAQVDAYEAGRRAR